MSRQNLVISRDFLMQEIQATAWISLYLQILQIMWTLENWLSLFTINFYLDNDCYIRVY